MVRTNQGGSVLSFVIVGVILVGLAIGGAYGVRQLMSQPQPSDPKTVATEPDKTEETPASKPDEKTEEAPAENKPAEATPQQTQSVAPSTSMPAPAVGALPQTGPIENFGALIALSLLSIASVSYVRSRRLELPL